MQDHLHAGWSLYQLNYIHSHVLHFNWHPGQKSGFSYSWTTVTTLHSHVFQAASAWAFVKHFLANLTSPSLHVLTPALFLLCSLK